MKSSAIATTSGRVRKVQMGWLLGIALSGVIVGSLATPEPIAAAPLAYCESDRCVQGLFCTNAPQFTGCDVQDAFPQLCVTYDCEPE